MTTKNHIVVWRNFRTVYMQILKMEERFRGVRKYKDEYVDFFRGLTNDLGLFDVTSAGYCPELSHEIIFIIGNDRELDHLICEHELTTEQKAIDYEAKVNATLRAWAESLRNES